MMLSKSADSANPSAMKTLTATDAKNRFGLLIDMAQAEPVRITRRGRDVAIVLSPEEFRRMSEAASGKVNPAIERLHAASAKRWARVYEALAK
jgi:antitoxin Phd